MHQRNTQAMHGSRRCGAKTRKGAPCMAPAVSDKLRCRMHGGAIGSGAPRRNKNALRTGAYTTEAMELRAELRSVYSFAKDIFRARPK